MMTALTSVLLMFLLGMAIITIIGIALFIGLVYAIVSVVASYLRSTEDNPHNIKHQLKSPKSDAADNQIN